MKPTVKKLSRYLPVFLILLYINECATSNSDTSTSNSSPSCTQHRVFQHDLASGSMGSSPSNFSTIVAPTILTVSANTCTKLTNGSQSATTMVTRSGNTRTISIGSEIVILQLSGDNITTTSTSLDNAFCKNALTNISGTLNYGTKKLNWQYDLKATQVSNCSAF
jgi:hypothetical protein